MLVRSNLFGASLTVDNFLMLRACRRRSSRGVVGDAWPVMVRALAGPVAQGPVEHGAVELVGRAGRVHGSTLPRDIDTFRSQPVACASSMLVRDDDGDRVAETGVGCSGYRHRLQRRPGAVVAGRGDAEGDWWMTFVRTRPRSHPGLPIDELLGEAGPHASSSRPSLTAPPAALAGPSGSVDGPDGTCQPGAAR